MKHDVQEKGNVSLPLFLINLEGVFYFHALAEEVKEQAAEKVDDAKDKATELAATAQETAQGKSRWFPVWKL